MGGILLEVYFPLLLILCERSDTVSILNSALSDGPYSVHICLSPVLCYQAISSGVFTLCSRWSEEGGGVQGKPAVHAFFSGARTWAFSGSSCSCEQAKNL